METRCRKCRWCLRQRSILWRQRAIAECALAPRTWLGTLTLRPEEQYRAMMRGRQLWTARGINWDAENEDQKLCAAHMSIGREITLMMKRLRKVHRARCRYIVVAELHKSGLPHYHMLLHETDENQPIRHSVLAPQWNLGFSKWKLVDDRPAAARYVAKYISKQSIARVRASQRYGSGSRNVLNIGVNDAVKQQTTYERSIF